MTLRGRVGSLLNSSHSWPIMTNSGPLKKKRVDIKLFLEGELAFEIFTQPEF